jgi:SLOG cluster2
LINYLGWPYTRSLTATQVADAFGVTRYVKVPFPGENSDVNGDPWIIAEAATHTRRVAVHGGFLDIDGRVISQPAGLVALGGQVSGFAGFLPGVAEEIAVALEQGIGVYVLGGFGGAAEQVTALMSGKEANDLLLDKFMIDPRYQALSQAAEKRGLKGELRGRLEWLRGVLRRDEFHNGLTKKENAVLWKTTNMGLAMALVTRGLRNITALSVLLIAHRIGTNASPLQCPKRPDNDRADGPKSRRLTLINPKK